MSLIKEEKTVSVEVTYHVSKPLYGPDQIQTPHPAIMNFNGIMVQGEVLPYPMLTFTGWVYMFGLHKESHKPTTIHFVPENCITLIK